MEHRHREGMVHTGSRLGRACDRGKHCDEVVSVLVKETAVCTKHNVKLLLKVIVVARVGPVETPGFDRGVSKLLLAPSNRRSSTRHARLVAVRQHHSCRLPHPTTTGMAARVHVRVEGWQSGMVKE